MCIRDRPHPHQAPRVKDAGRFLVTVVELVDIPSKNGTVEPGGDEVVVLHGVLDVLDPIGVAPHGLELLFQVPRVPQGDRGVVGASRKKSVVQKVDAIDRVLVSRIDMGDQ